MLPDWSDKLAHAFVLGKRKEPGLTVHDIIRRGIRIMERMQEKAFYENSTAFMREDSHFTGCTDEELLRLRDRIAQWIGQAIDQRAVLGWAMHPLLAQAEPSARTEALNAVRGLCWTTHDVLWVAWKANEEIHGRSAHRMGRRAEESDNARSVISRLLLKS